MYKELKKYATGKKIPEIYSIVGTKHEMVMDMDEYIFPAGDFISDFIKHQSKPFWKKDLRHNHITEIYFKILNKVSFSYNF